MRSGNETLGHVVVQRRHDVAGGTRRGSAEVRRHIARAAVRTAGVLLALVLLAAPLPASAAGRVALVVGNSTYEHIGRLPNPANDAADLSAALRRLGFDVTVAQDAGRPALTEALRAFTRRSAGADVALVFYAGHGMEMDGVNYLLPVDARLERDTDVRYETVTLDDVLASTAGAGLRLVILDACRNNPLARSMTRTVRTRNVSNGSFGDLDDALLGDETLVAYSAEAGTVADDGAGRNSPYAAALLAHLEERLEVGMLFRRVRERVLNATDGRQRPHEYHSLLREHYLGVAPAGGLASAGGTAGPAAAVAASGSSPVLAQQETVFWESVRESANPAELEAYLARWPNGVYAPLARTRVAALRPAVVDLPIVRQQDDQAVRRAIRDGVIGRLGVVWERDAVVSRVVEGGPAESAGMRAGDIIQMYDGRPIGNSEELTDLLIPTSPGATVPIEVVRDAQRLTFDVTIGRDDYPRCLEDRTKRVEAPSSTAGRLNDNFDTDCFRIDLREGGLLTVNTDGGTDTVGRLVGNDLDVSDDDAFGSRNFHIRRDVLPGSYYVVVSGYSGATGDYILKVRQQDLEVFRDCPDCPEMVVIPAGEFQMGSDRNDDEANDFERPRHRVSVGQFALGRYEVTRAEYEAFVSATGHSDGRRCRTDDGRGNWEWRWRNGASWRDPRFPQGDDHPVVCVSWEDAQSYVRWLSRKTGERYRLPSEAEWEYAARAGTETRWYWGDSPSGQCGRANGADAFLRRKYRRVEGLDFDHAVSCDDGMAHTAPAGSYDANAFGLFDVLGNVWEWTEDCMNRNYARAPNDGSAWTRGDCGRRVIRGGSWSRASRRLRAAERAFEAAGDRIGHAGFRVSRTLD